MKNPPKSGSGIFPVLPEPAVPAAASAGVSVSDTPAPIGSVNIPPDDTKAQPVVSDAPAVAPYGYKVDGTPRGKPGAKTGGGSGIRNPTIPGKTAAPVTPGVDKFRSSAESTVLTVEGLCAGLISDEWKFRDKGEKDMMIDATEKYFRAQNIPDIPPGVMLIIVIGMYAGPRFAMPKTREKFAQLRAKIKPKTETQIITPSPL